MNIPSSKSNHIIVINVPKIFPNFTVNYTAYTFKIMHMYTAALTEEIQVTHLDEGNEAATQPGIPNLQDQF